MARRLSRRPNLSPGIPASMDPRIVPQSAAETVIPRAAGDRRNVSVSACVVPAITAVSNPKRSPPSAATTVLFRRYELSFILPLEISSEKVTDQAELTKDETEEHTLYMRSPVAIIKRFSPASDSSSLAKRSSAPSYICQWLIQLNRSPKFRSL